MTPAKWQASAIFKIAHLSNQREQNKAQFYTEYPMTTTTKRTLYRKQFNISIWRLASLWSCNPAATTYVLVSWQLTAPRCLPTWQCDGRRFDHNMPFRIVPTTYMDLTPLLVPMSQEVGRRANDVISVITATRTTTTSNKCRHSPAVRVVKSHVFAG